MNKLTVAAYAFATIAAFSVPALGAYDLNDPPANECSTQNWAATANQYNIKIERVREICNYASSWRNQAAVAREALAGVHTDAVARREAREAAEAAAGIAPPPTPTRGHLSPQCMNELSYFALDPNFKTVLPQFSQDRTGTAMVRYMRSHMSPACQAEDAAYWKKYCNDHPEVDHSSG